MCVVLVVVYMQSFDHCSRLKCSWTLSCSIVNEISCYCMGGYCGIAAWSSALRCCQLLLNQGLWSSATWITQLVRPPIVDSVDVHFQKGAGSLLHAMLPLKAANTSFMTVCNPLALRQPRMQNHKLLMLPWRSFSGWGWEGVPLFCDYNGGQ